MPAYWFSSPRLPAVRFNEKSLAGGYHGTSTSVIAILQFDIHMHFLPAVKRVQFLPKISIQYTPKSSQQKTRFRNQLTKSRRTTTL